MRSKESDFIGNSEGLFRDRRKSAFLTQMLKRETMPRGWWIEHAGTKPGLAQSSGCLRPNLRKSKLEVGSAQVFRGECK